MALRTFYDEKRYLDDVLNWETDQRYCRDTVIFKNDTSVSKVFTPGTLIKLDTDPDDNGVTPLTVAPADTLEAAIGFLTVRTEELAADETQVLKAGGAMRGPLLYNPGELVKVATATGDETAADKAHLDALEVLLMMPVHDPVEDASMRGK